MPFAAPKGDGESVSMIQRVKAGRIRLKVFRASCGEKYQKFNTPILVLIPILLVLMTEYNHVQSVTGMFQFLLCSFNIFLFDVLVSAVVFTAILMLVQKAWIAVLSDGLLLYILSCVEFFKYQTSGSHFSFSDLALAGEAGDVARFATLFLTKELVFNFVLLFAMVIVTFLLDVKLNVRLRFRLCGLAGCCAAVCLFLFVPQVSNQVFDVFNVAREPSVNTFTENEKFESNYMIAYLTQSTVEKVENSVKKPKNYSKNTVDKALSEATPATTDVRPNVIFVMSESFSDFRKFESLKIDDSIYENYDRIGKEGFLGKAVVPTFGGATVRTEFELMFGLPVRSLNNALVPHDILDENRQQATFVRYFQGIGYDTAYIHPFSSTFYGRDKVYSTYGFDRMIFQDDLTVEQKTYKRYVDDKTVFDQITKLLKENAAPSYLYATTMQNHQPYKADGEPGGDQELDYYLEGIDHTDKELGAFIDSLKELGEPTVVVFIGDHMPFFSSDCDVYEKLGVANGESHIIYEQSYLVWANYDFDYSALKSDEISAFYIPTNVANAAGLPLTRFVSTMKDEMEKTPVYTYSMGSKPDTTLDLITYDRALGEQYSESE